MPRLIGAVASALLVLALPACSGDHTVETATVEVETDASASASAVSPEAFMAAIEPLSIGTTSDLDWLDSGMAFCHKMTRTQSSFVVDKHIESLTRQGGSRAEARSWVSAAVFNLCPENRPVFTAWLQWESE